jgi:hypothetical protein
MEPYDAAFEAWMHREHRDVEWAQFKARLQELMVQAHVPTPGVALILQDLATLTRTTDRDAFVQARLALAARCEAYGAEFADAMEVILSDWFEVQDDIMLEGLS